MDKRQSLMASKIAQPINYYYLIYTPNLTHVLTNVSWVSVKLGRLGPEVPNQALSI